MQFSGFNCCSYKLDILGVFISSFLTALGGGMIRDALADRTPMFLLQKSSCYFSCCNCLISLLFKLHKIDDLEGKTTL